MKSPDLRLVFWETTVGCNLECVHCRRLEVSKILSREDMTTEEALYFIGDLAENFSPPPVLVLSGGEPLMRPDIFELTHEAVNRGVQVALATNGTLVDESLARKIVDSGVRRVAISLDGSSPQTHDSFRKMPGSFERAVRGFKYLKSLGMSMQVNATLTRHNIHELGDIYRLSLELGADSLHYFLLVPVGCGLEIKKEYQLTPEEYEEALLKIYDFASERKLYIRPTCAPHYFRILAQKKSTIPRTRDTSSLNQMTKGCLAGSGILFVSHKGEVFPCGYLPTLCGNVHTQSLRTIWDRSEIFKAFRDTELLHGKCGWCEFKNICSGCRARAFEESGCFLGEEPNCLYEPRMRKATQI